jgi:hypothetical protein
MLRNLVVRFIAIVSLTSLLLVSGVIVTARSDQTAALQWKTFLQANADEQTVFVLGTYESLWRITPDAPLTTLKEPLYATTRGLQVKPFGPGHNPVGPYEIGDPLGFTLGEWLNARGTGTVTLTNVAQVELVFDGLVANGLYSLWCVYRLPPPDVATSMEPCGTDNTFVADGHGALTLSQTFPRPWNKSVSMVLVLVWHRDDQTYGDAPDLLGYKTFIHLHAPVSLATE